MAQRKQTKRTGARGNVRVRAKALTDVDETKLALAFWLIAKRLVDDQTDQAGSDDSDGAGTAS